MEDRCFHRGPPNENIKRTFFRVAVNPRGAALRPATVRSK
jgi:hypothetical protein